jgi:tRNA(Ile)-lysidine synthase
LIDDVLRLSQRDDHDHQTALFWQGRKHAYTIRRYRQRLYRLSIQWLAWLNTPLTNQTNLIHHLNLADNNSLKTALEPITLRTNKDFVWQLKIRPQALGSLWNTDKSEETLIVLKVTPLDRKQRLKTVFSTHSQSGKKLYQLLGIPLWLRESLVMISVALVNGNNLEQNESELLREVPILLLSPFDSWILRSDELISQISLTELIENDLRTSHTP